MVSPKSLRIPPEISRRGIWAPLRSWVSSLNPFWGMADGTWVVSGIPTEGLGVARAGILANSLDLKVGTHGLSGFSNESGVSGVSGFSGTPKLEGFSGIGDRPTLGANIHAK